MTISRTGVTRRNMRRVDCVFALLALTLRFAGGFNIAYNNPATLILQEDDVVAITDLTAGNWVCILSGGGPSFGTAECTGPSDTTDFGANDDCTEAASGTTILNLEWGTVANTHIAVIECVTDGGGGGNAVGSQKTITLTVGTRVNWVADTAGYFKITGSKVGGRIPTTLEFQVDIQTALAAAEVVTLQTVKGTGTSRTPYRMWDAGDSTSSCTVDIDGAEDPQSEVTAVTASAGGGSTVFDTLTITVPSGGYAAESTVTVVCSNANLQPNELTVVAQIRGIMTTTDDAAPVISYRSPATNGDNSGVCGVGGDGTYNYATTIATVLTGGTMVPSPNAAAGAQPTSSVLTLGITTALVATNTITCTFSQQVFQANDVTTTVVVGGSGQTATAAVTGSPVGTTVTITATSAIAAASTTFTFETNPNLAPNYATGVVQVTSCVSTQDAGTLGPITSFTTTASQGGLTVTATQVAAFGTAGATPTNVIVTFTPILRRRSPRRQSR